MYACSQKYHCLKCHSTPRSSPAWIDGTVKMPPGSKLNCTKCHTSMANGDKFWCPKGNVFVTTAICDACHNTISLVPRSGGKARTYSWAHKTLRQTQACGRCGSIKKSGDLMMQWGGSSNTYRCLSCHQKQSTTPGAAKTSSAVPTWYRFILLKNQTEKCEICHKIRSTGHFMVQNDNGITAPIYRCHQCHKAILLHAVGALYSPKPHSRAVGVSEALRGIKTSTNPVDGPNYSTVECGTAPKSVQCACFGFARYKVRVDREIGKWIPHLVSLFGAVPGDSQYHVHETMHDAGIEYTVKFYYHKDNKAQLEYATRLFEGLPNTWKETIDKPDTQVNTDSNLVYDNPEWEKHHTSPGTYMLTCSSCGQNSQGQQGVIFYVHGGYRHRIDSNKNSLCTKCFVLGGKK